MSQINVSFRVTAEQQDQIVRAAEASGKTLSDYCRDILSPWAASDLGERPASAPERVRRPQSPVTLAAQKRGMSRDEFRQLAAELLAQADLQPSRRTMLPAPHIEEPVQRPSEIRQATRVGAYRVARAIGVR